MNNNFIKPKVLIVEDETENQKFFQLVLRNDFETEICSSGKEFLEKLVLFDYDVVVMDVNLKSDENGFELIRRMRKSSPKRKVPVVCLSAYDYVNEDLRIGSDDVDVYLSKPVSRKILLQTLKDLIKEKFPQLIIK